ncbi:MAG: MFS transporter [Chloroflexota bacterium]|nr:MFS transporter [Chloroflexota bacterium]
MSAAERQALLLTLGFLAFAAVYNGLVMSPVLEQMAREFGITTGTAGLVVAAYGAPGIAVALVAGPYSDRIGRKPFLVVGPLVMGISTLAAAIAPTFGLIIAARIASGIGASVLFPNINATIADTFPFRERGRAIATAIGMNTMASVVGVPIAGIVAEATSWRVSVALVGALAIVAAIVLFVRMPNAKGTNRESKIRALYALILGDRSAVAAVLSSFLGALFWFTWATYLVVYFQRTFRLSEGPASTVALTLGLGVLIGSQIGGRLGDRIGHRRIVAGSVVIAGFLLLLQTNLPLPLAATAALNLTLSAVIGARFATNNALMSEQVPEARGTMLALSAAVASVAIVVGALVGGILVDGPGFGLLGVFCFAVAAGSAAIVLLFVREEPIDLEVQPLR